MGTILLRGRFFCYLTTLLQLLKHLKRVTDQLFVYNTIFGCFFNDMGHTSYPVESYDELGVKQNKSVVAYIPSFFSMN
jgi:hypothetical protein